ncbi:MAG: DUF115 domain-containing protein [Phycisphaerales bacterium]|nr:DUF115 domain-containing protein [Phycisphaerales bacterium]
MSSTIDPDPQILEANLRAIAVRSPRAAQRIMEAAPTQTVEFIESPSGDIVGILDGRALGSKRNPMREAITWAQQHSPQDAGFLGVIGFAMGHHLRALHQSHGKHSVLLCFEPDLGLLRAVLERIDHSDWINESIFLLATDASDASELTQLLNHAEAFLATGVELAPHPPSKHRLGERAGEFSSTLLDVVRSTRTHLVTVLAHSGFTLRNILMNAGLYATRAGIESLKDTCKDRTAILISAGPSLERNLHLLEDQSIRDRAVIIAVQTMLKPLLKRGIKPHFITALDHHEISKRFYEGLTPEDVEGVRLVMEPKANAAIAQAFPGEILCTQEQQLDNILGDELIRPMGKLPAGATVAHLNYYLARHLGCSKIILIGQDLGFTDGQYYSSGASIHSVWAGELSEHRTLEMFEWERIARMKNLLRAKRDIHGRQIFTDEQMSTYIAQFEADFKQDQESDPDLRIINATEGGVQIAYMQPLPLSAAIDQCIDDRPIEIPETQHLVVDDEQRRIKVRARFTLVLKQLESIARNSPKTLDLISSALEKPDDERHIDRCISKIHVIRDDVMASEPGFGLVNFINQKGGLDRFKVDRLIALETDLTQTQRQIKQLERDANNIRWIESSVKEVQNLMERSLAVFECTAQPMTRDEFADESDLESNPVSTSASPRRVEAVIFADPELGPLGQPRDLSRPIHRGLNALELTTKRIASSNQLDGITIISTDPDRISAMTLGDGNLPIRIVRADPQTLRARALSIGKARAASSDCWRGSIASLGCYDESLDPQTLESVMDQHSIDAAAIVGSDWAMVDPALVDQIVARHRADPDHCHIPFSQAVPGLGCCVLDRGAVGSLSTAAQRASAFGSIGAMLSYIPIGPQGDPIASPLCVGIDPFIRDAGIRVIADSPIRARAMSAVYQGLGDFAMAAETTVLLRAYLNELDALQQRVPERIELELTTQSLAQGEWSIMRPRPDSPITMDQQPANALMTQAHALNTECSLLLAGRGDPLMHQQVMPIIEHASTLGIMSTELRTNLLDMVTNSTHTPQQILNSGISILSVDLLANTPQLHQHMTGSPKFEAVLDTMQSLFTTRSQSAQSPLPTPWIVPRLTRCDAVYNDLLGFYDRWLSVCGCAIIDPPTPTTPGRIKSLRVPDHRAKQMSARTLRIAADGQVVDEHHQPIESDRPINAIELGIEEAYRQMRSALESSSTVHSEPKPLHQQVVTQ